MDFVRQVCAVSILVTFTLVLQSAGMAALIQWAKAHWIDESSKLDGKVEVLSAQPSTGQRRPDLFKGMDISKAATTFGARRSMEKPASSEHSAERSESRWPLLERRYPTAATPLPPPKTLKTLSEAS